MTKKPKMELTWVGNENNPRLEPRIRIEFADVPEKEDSPVRCHEAILDVCSKPRCPCANIQFQCTPASGDADVATALGPPRKFWFNINKKSVVMTPELEKDAELLGLAEVVRSELTEADQQQLRRWFLAEKLDIIQTTLPSEIDITALPDADDGKMIGFVDVFPCGLALNFALNNEAWAVDEQYCVQPGCACKETILSFLMLMDATGQRITEIKSPPAIRYNYRSEATAPTGCWPAGSPSVDLLLAALKCEHPSLNLQLELRHNIMQLLYARHCMERTKSHLHSLSAKTVPSVARKIGRNEPCPCGSGRKYKQCCLNKPQS